MEFLMHRFPWHLLSCVATLGLLLSADAGAATFIVSNTGNSGAGTLRQAMLDANANPGLDTIAFNIPGTGPHNILVTSSLPGINSPVLIDGYTQPGASTNTLGVGSNAQIRVAVIGPGTLGVTAFTLLVGSTGSTIRGLAINRFRGSQISATLGGGNCVITGNFIGTDPTGAIVYPSPLGTQTGVSAGGPGCRIGGPVRADRNVVSGHSLSGIYVGGDNIVVQGNLVGTDRTGTSALSNRRGISIGATGPGTLTLNALIGGENVGTQAPRNVISGNEVVGIEVVSGQGHAIEGNLIGLAALPLATVPNRGPGIHVRGGRGVRIGAVAAGSISNAIIGNEGPGILISGSASNDAEPQDIMVVGNNIGNNDGIGIDLAVGAAADGVTANDPLDADQGPNTLQNFPVLTRVVYGAGQTQIHGQLSAEASRGYYIDLYRSAVACHASGHGGSTDYLGFVSVTTDASGVGQFEAVFDSVLDSGFATATATAGPQLVGPTSEFSRCLKLGDLLFANGFDPS